MRNLLSAVAGAVLFALTLLLPSSAWAMDENTPGVITAPAASNAPGILARELVLNRRVVNTLLLSPEDKAASNNAMQEAVGFVESVLVDALAKGPNRSALMQTATGKIDNSQKYSMVVVDPSAPNFDLVHDLVRNYLGPLYADLQSQPGCLFLSLNVKVTDAQKTTHQARDALLVCKLSFLYRRKSIYVAKHMEPPERSPF